MFIELVVKWTIVWFRIEFAYKFVTFRLNYFCGAKKMTKIA